MSGLIGDPQAADTPDLKSRRREMDETVLDGIEQAC